MRLSRPVFLSSVFSAVLVAACGSNSSTSSGGAAVSTSGVTTTKLLVGLNEAERGAVCDWRAAKLGGYGTTHVCPKGDGTNDTVTLAPDKKTCIANFNAGLRADCALTVGEFEIVERSNAACNPEAGYEDAYTKLFDCLVLQ
jgi:hypothetical protein